MRSMGMGWRCRYLRPSVPGTWAVYAEINTLMQTTIISNFGYDPKALNPDPAACSTRTCGRWAW